MTKTVKNGLKHCKWQNKFKKIKKIHTIRMLYMTFDISFSIFIFFYFFFNFHFFKTGIFGYFWFLAKNAPKLQELFKKRSKSSIFPIIFHISLKKIHFLTLTFFLGPLTWNRPIEWPSFTMPSKLKCEECFITLNLYWCTQDCQRPIPEDVLHLGSLELALL